MTLPGDCCSIFPIKVTMSLFCFPGTGTLKWHAYLRHSMSDPRGAQYPPTVDEDESEAFQQILGDALAFFKPKKRQDSRYSIPIFITLPIISVNANMGVTWFGGHCVS